MYRAVDNEVVQLAQWMLTSHCRFGGQKDPEKRYAKCLTEEVSDQSHLCQSSPTYFKPF